MTWELRWHPFRAEWVLFTSHRGARPWIGQAVAPDEPSVPDDNALGPGGTRIVTTNPDYRGVFVFTNDLPVFSAAAPDPGPGDEVYRTERAGGTAEVVCYHHDPTRSMADLTDDEVTAVVTTWRERTPAARVAQSSRTSSAGRHPGRGSSSRASISSPASRGSRELPTRCTSFRAAMRRHSSTSTTRSAARWRWCCARWSVATTPFGASACRM